MRQNWLVFAGVFGFLAVALGAFAAHGLRGRVDDQRMSQREFDAFRTGAEYQMYHALALVGVQVAANRRRSMCTLIAGYAFVLGILVFSGSLYAFALSGQTKFGMITPFGGVAFLVGWAALAIASLQKRDTCESSV